MVQTADLVKNVFLLLFVLGFSSSFVSAVFDSDSDGVPDEFDKCPDSDSWRVDGYGCTCMQKLKLPEDYDGDKVWHCLDEGDICKPNCILQGAPPKPVCLVGDSRIDFCEKHMNQNPDDCAWPFSHSCKEGERCRVDRSYFLEDSYYVDRDFGYISIGSSNIEDDTRSVIDYSKLQKLQYRVADVLHEEKGDLLVHDVFASVKPSENIVTSSEKFGQCVDVCEFKDSDPPHDFLVDPFVFVDECYFDTPYGCKDDGSFVELIKTSKCIQSSDYFFKDYLLSCKDGLVYGKCVPGEPPLYCRNGDIVDSCNNCGCARLDEFCLPDGSCNLCDDWEIKEEDCEFPSGVDGRMVKFVCNSNHDFDHYVDDRCVPDMNLRNTGWYEDDVLHILLVNMTDVYFNVLEKDHGQPTMDLEMDYWKDVLSFVTYMFWTQNQDVVKNDFMVAGFKKDGYSYDFDIDAIVDNINSGRFAEVYLYGDIPSRVAAEFDFRTDAKFTKVKDHPLELFWLGVKDMVVVFSQEEDTYKNSLVASTYASIFNKPFIIINQGNKDRLLLARSVDVVGDIPDEHKNFLEKNGVTINEMSILDVQREIYRKTETNKFILVNPYDIFWRSYFKYRTETSQTKYSFFPESLLSPILAAAKQELLIPVENQNTFFDIYEGSGEVVYSLGDRDNDVGGNAAQQAEHVIAQQMDSSFEQNLEKIGVRKHRNQYLTILGNPVFIPLSHPVGDLMGEVKQSGVKITFVKNVEEDYDSRLFGVWE